MTTIKDLDKNSPKNFSEQKTISVCIIGKPNAGKSSLLNNILGQKISIVTPKVQTTRSIITGIHTMGNTQIILFDTPGIFDPKKTLERAMVRCAWSSLNGADLVVLIIDGSRALDKPIIEILQRLKSQGIRPVLLINKIDLKSEHIKNIEDYLALNYSEVEVFKISALTNQNIKQLIKFIIEKAEFSVWHYEEDELTTLPMRFLASEITREQLFLNLHEELPYNLTVQTESWQQLDDGSVKINQVIIVSRENYKTMIIGKNGAMIKKIGIEARAEIIRSLDIKVHLFLFVKVRPLWETNPEHYQYMGLKMDKSSSYKKNQSS